MMAAELNNDNYAFTHVAVERYKFQYAYLVYLRMFNDV